MIAEEKMDVSIMTESDIEDSVFFENRNSKLNLISSVTSMSGKELKQAECRKIDFLEILGSKYMNAILSQTSVKECSANELSNELNIPIATVYRKLKLLEEFGLVENVKTIINISGNEEKFYHCLISEATVNFHEGNISMNVKMIDHVNKINRIWKRFTKSADMTKKEGMEA